jgi:phosphopantetheine adenylyltransferase
MKSFDILVNSLLHEANEDVYTVGIFPGAFKPPHVGHYTTALNACKVCDEVNIFVSAKARALSTQNKAGDTSAPDSARYKNLIHSDKFTDNILSVQTAGVARMTSASAFRVAISTKDKNTIIKNIPESVDADLVFNILMSSNDINDEGYGHVTIEQTMAIWRLYASSLIQESGIDSDKLNINISKISPVKDTYDLVDEINNDERARMTSVKLYVGE